MKTSQVFNSRFNDIHKRPGIDKKMQVRLFLADLVDNSRIPGIQYLVLDPNRVIFEYTGGWADLKNHRQMKPDTTMMAYSMTKTVTAAAVLQLIADGKLNVDDYIGDILNNTPYGTAVKIEHLLSHTSGIPNPLPLKWVHPVEEHAIFDEEGTLTQVIKDHRKLAFVPGQKYKYSNIAYWLLGKIIERVSGMDFKEYMAKNIFRPLGIPESKMNFEIPDLSNHAKGYLNRYSLFNVFKGLLIDRQLVGQYESKWLHIRNHYPNGPAFGGIVGTARGFAQFLQDQLKEDSCLFGKQSKELFFTQYKNTEGDVVEMTYGWHIGVVDDRKYFFKEGGGGGYHSEMRIYPEKRIATIIMVNKTNFNSTNFLNQVDSGQLPGGSL